MRGLGLIIGFLLGNKETRDWLIKHLDQASRSIEKQFKKTELGKIFSQTPVAETIKEKVVEKKPDFKNTEDNYAQKDLETD